DCIEGNQLLFVSTAEVKEMWAYVDPILRAWRESKVPLVHYQPDTAVIRKDATRQIEASVPIRPLKKELVVIGLGKMGGNLVRNLLNKNWKVAGYNRSSEDTKLLERQGMIGIYDLKEIRRAIARPRIVWLMLPAGKTVDEVIFSKGGLISLLDKGDIIVDAGNSFYQDAVVRSQKLQKSGIDFADVGFSGGPGGAQSGACLMVGGDKKLFEYLLPLYTDMAVVQGVAFFAGAGAGHFVKMIHNGIEYGMMQAIAEGFTVLKESAYKLDLQQAAEVYNHGSVVESRLIGWLADGLARYGVELEQISSTVRHTGEGEWTVKTAKKMGLKTQVIDVALKFRQQSEKNPSYTGKILSTLRNMFGGHTTK
ncbi:decarboxylating 6-phosphogluconate dehydrogenase, partial [Candidatus Roizmanbacteria bacterium]|nr:decarboxylating 6-phosphogluconate dehydrogenase [Candidatus Roizmanbacteria bacterium]